MLPPVWCALLSFAWHMATKGSIAMTTSDVTACSGVGCLCVALLTMSFSILFLPMLRHRQEEDNWQQKHTEGGDTNRHRTRYTKCTGKQQHVEGVGEGGGTQRHHKASKAANVGSPYTYIIIENTYTLTFPCMQVYPWLPVACWFLLNQNKKLGIINVTYHRTILTRILYFVQT